MVQQTFYFKSWRLNLQLGKALQGEPRNIVVAKKIDQHVSGPFTVQFGQAPDYHVSALPMNPVASQPGEVVIMTFVGDI